MSLKVKVKLKVKLKSDKKVRDITDFIKQEEINNKGKISREFEHVCISNLNCKQAKNSFQLDQEALTCGCGGTRVPMPREAVASCTTCGSQINYVDDQGPVEYRPEVEILSPFAYKRINHFKEWLKAGQKSILLNVFSLYIKINSCGADKGFLHPYTQMLVFSFN